MQRSDGSCSAKYGVKVHSHTRTDDTSPSLSMYVVCKLSHKVEHQGTLHPALEGQSLHFVTKFEWNYPPTRKAQFSCSSRTLVCSRMIYCCSRKDKTLLETLQFTMDFKAAWFLCRRFVKFSSSAKGTTSIILRGNAREKLQT